MRFILRYGLRMKFACKKKLLLETSQRSLFLIEEIDDGIVEYSFKWNFLFLSLDPNDRSHLYLLKTIWCVQNFNLKIFIFKLNERSSTIFIEVTSEILDCYLWNRIKDLIYIYSRFWDMYKISIQNFWFRNWARVFWYCFWGLW